MERVNLPKIIKKLINLLILIWRMKFKIKFKLLVNSKNIFDDLILLIN
ncbi:hypothetical protein EU96_1520 [Prochlorococcus marinus str. MIT 9302]|uniref:Uncharacterized protein n=1 Tax=Prochlorococcus marinus str. MIT 9302 TaxID=74545 RepID=A0A0A2A8Y6_PROMR|nr:hypothetical protein EU96_1520 [Prochlorococcus marinus str. MIT 9302]